MTLAAWLPWAEQQLARLIIAEKLHVGLAEVVEGPTVVTFRLRLAARLGRSNLNKLLALGPAIGQALHTSPVRVTGSEQGVLVEVPHPRPWTPHAAALARRTTGPDHLAAGLDSRRRPVFLDLTRTPHLLFIGPTRRGKTTALKAMLGALALALPPGRLQIAILARKAANWRAFAPAAACLDLLTASAGQEQYAAWLLAELDRRARSGRPAARLITVVDDAHDLARNADLGDALARLASLGGELGLHLFATTQNSGHAGGLGPAVEANMTARLVFGAADAAMAARFAGVAGAGAGDVGRIPGDALLICDGHSQRLATARCPDAWLARLPAAGVSRKQPWFSEPVLTSDPLASAPRQDRWRAPEPVSAGSAGSGDAGPVLALPLPTGRLPAAAEAAAIRRYRQDHSLNATVEHFYGSKNGRTVALVKQACPDRLTEADRRHLHGLDPAPSRSNARILPFPAAQA